MVVWGVIAFRGRLPEPSAYPNMWSSFHAVRLIGLAASVFVVVLLVTVLLMLMRRADLDGRREKVVYGSDVSKAADGEGAGPLSGQAPAVSRRPG
jgi:hypothetical protein